MQEIWLKNLSFYGYAVKVCYSCVAAKITLEHYLKLQKDPAKDMLSRLAFLLKRHAKNISNVNEKFLDFWQKDICQHWDNILGCTAGESDCDSCSSFLRIRVQHCKRCGADFYERKENNFCEACRTARLKQARKKWAILQNKKGI